MKQRGLEPNVITYSALISACEKGQKPEDAIELFKAMKWEGVVPDVITYNALISACEKGQKFEQALKLFHAMQQQGVVPDVITYNALISAPVRKASSQSRPWSSARQCRGKVWCLM